ncbi:MAG TPA: FtsQ-type POTRA domain-containing protein [Solirubrobacteraceae bacterium]|nr:FtsQ-type POTRA domain-containing protein [Solirubrobacteraceae bacterium]
MDRSFAGRLGIGSLTRPTSRSAKRPRGRSAGARPRSRSANATPLDRAIEQLWHAASLAAQQLTRGASFVWARRRLRIAAIALALALALLGGGWLWLRNSSLVSVEHVRISGLHGADAHAIEAALTNAARQMSTLDVQQGKLRAAVASYPVVGDLRVHTSFPHGIGIEVVEQPPVAMLSSPGGVEAAVSASGVVLGTAHASEALPALTSSAQLTPGERVREPALVADLAVLGAAPARLAKDVERAYSGPKGLTLAMHGGLLAYFGDASRPHAKWIALARVLADSSSTGASYVDVRSPERPAAGFAAGVAPPSATGETEGSSTPSASESAESLAQGLTSATGATSEPQASGSTEAANGEASGGEAESESAGSESSEASGASTTETHE